MDPNNPVVEQSRDNSWWNRDPLVVKAAVVGFATSIAVALGAFGLITEEQRDIIITQVGNITVGVVVLAPLVISLCSVRELPPRLRYSTHQGQPGLSLPCSVLRSRLLQSTGKGRVAPGLYCLPLPPHRPITWSQSISERMPSQTGQTTSAFHPSR
jgi:hypothetical protein